MSKKVGILTHYYHSNNYGGNLQAYALTRFINSLKGFYAEQISYDLLGKSAENQCKGILNFIRLFLQHPRLTIKSKVRYFILSVKRFHINGFAIGFAQLLLDRKFALRNKSIISFNEHVIPHSNRIFTNANIVEANALYDIFITGSDQVWSSYGRVFSLDFVDLSKTRMSYAASVSRKELSESDSQKFKNALTHYKAISVRDKTDFKIISNLTSKNVRIVLDPVFLLSANEWDEIIPKKKKASGKYIFCYLLGDSKHTKEIAANFALSKNLQFVYIPHFKDNENAMLENDLHIDGKQLYDVSPADFVGLIKNAEYVLTDSFHATVFSIIYNRQFFCFERKSRWGDMSSRLINLLSSVECLDHYCSGYDKVNLSYMNSIKSIDYNVVELLYLEKLNYSKNFLKDVLEGKI